MRIREEDIRDEAVKAVAREIMLAIRTAPKTRGIDNLSIMLVDGDDLQAVADRMDRICEESGGKRPSFQRDAKGVRASQAVIAVGVKSPPYGLDCAYCGFPTCADKNAHPGVPCVFGMIDLGIGVGVAGAKLGEKHIDNRLMFSMGMAMMQLGWFPDGVTMALGYPLSVSGKNIFFDRQV